jgi:hypothetical protein
MGDTPRPPPTALSVLNEMAGQAELHDRPLRSPVSSSGDADHVQHRGRSNHPIEHDELEEPSPRTLARCPSPIYRRGWRPPPPPPHPDVEAGLAEMVRKFSRTMEDQRSERAARPDSSGSASSPNHLTGSPPLRSTLPPTRRSLSPTIARGSSLPEDRDRTCEFDPELHTAQNSDSKKRKRGPDRRTMTCPICGKRVCAACARMQAKKQPPKNDSTRALPPLYTVVPLPTVSSARQPSPLFLGSFTQLPPIQPGPYSSPIQEIPNNFSQTSTVVTSQALGSMPMSPEPQHGRRRVPESGKAHTLRG